MISTIICSKANMLAVGIVFLFFLAGCLHFAAKDIEVDVNPTSVPSDKVEKPAKELPKDGPDLEKDQESSEEDKPSLG